jgi:hypothetical protein
VTSPSSLAMLKTMTAAAATTTTRRRKGRRRAPRRVRRCRAARCTSRRAAM